jgi:hypothetical protein
MITLLAATIVVALISLGAYIHVANERDYLAIEVANLEHRLKRDEGCRCGEDS